MGQVVLAYGHAEGGIVALDHRRLLLKYIVYCDHSLQVPSTVLATYVPLGSSIPNEVAVYNPQYQGLVAYAYDEGIETEAPDVWTSYVEFRSHEELEALDWVLEGEWADEQEHIARDESDSERVKILRYRTDGTTFHEETMVGKLIGHPVYKPITDAERAGYPGGWFTVQSSSGTPIYLGRTGAFKVTGFDRPRGVHRFALTKVIPNYSFAMMRRVGGLSGAVNKSIFWNYRPGFLRFERPTYREVVGAIPGIPSTAKSLEVRLHFAHNPEGWSPTVLYETYTDENGFESPIEDGNSGIFLAREYYGYRAEEFSRIFTFLNTIPPT